MVVAGVVLAAAAGCGPRFAPVTNEVPKSTGIMPDLRGKTPTESLTLLSKVASSAVIFDSVHHGGIPIPLAKLGNVAEKVTAQSPSPGAEVRNGEVMVFFGTGKRATVKGVPTGPWYWKHGPTTKGYGVATCFICHNEQRCSICHPKAAEKGQDAGALTPVFLASNDVLRPVMPGASVEEIRALHDSARTLRVAIKGGFESGRANQAAIVVIDSIFAKVKDAGQIRLVFFDASSAVLEVSVSRSTWASPAWKQVTPDTLKTTAQDYKLTP